MEDDVMDASKMKEILSKEFGINNEEEFNDAVNNSKGISIGIFVTQCFGKKGKSNEE